MNQFIEFLFNAQYIYHDGFVFWLLSSILLLIFEINLFTGGYLFCLGIAAMINAIFTLTWDLKGHTQIFLFILLSVVILIILLFCSKKLRQNQRPNPNNSNPLLNQRGEQLIGMIVVLEEPLINRYGRVKISDSSWCVYCQDDVKVGEKLKVVNLEGNTLIVESY